MTDPLTAKVLKVRGRFVHICCPYCGGEHEHVRFAFGVPERRAAGCALYASLTNAERASGYVFTVEKVEK